MLARLGLRYRLFWAGNDGVRSSACGFAREGCAGLGSAVQTLRSSRSLEDEGPLDGDHCRVVNGITVRVGALPR
jgi:hypothetical protein